MCASLCQSYIETLVVKLTNGQKTIDFDKDLYPKKYI